MSATPRRFARRSLLAGSVLAALAGCSGIPRDSAISTHELPAKSQGAANEPRPPQPGAQSVDIVRGFVRAHAQPAENFALARAFLTPEAAKEWHPREVLVVGESSEPSVSAAAQREVAATFVTLEYLGADGFLSQRAAASTERLTFTLERVDGEWRIASAPGVLALTRPQFLERYTPVAVQFLTSDFRYVVPDVCWFVKESAFAETLNRLALGPAPYLRGAVTTALPAEYAIPVDAVSVRDSHASLEVPEAVWRLPAQQRARALAQVLATLTTMPRVRSASATRKGARVHFGDLAVPEAATPPFRLWALEGSSLVRVDEDGRSHVILERDRLDFSYAAIRGRGSRIAMLTGAARTLNSQPLDQSAGPVSIKATGEFAPPTLDRWGYAWSVDTARLGFLVGLDPAGGEIALEADWIAPSRPPALEFSPDGTRLMTVLPLESGPVLALSALVRDRDGLPAAVTDPLRIPLPLSTVRGLHWFSDLSILVWGTAPGSNEPLALIWHMVDGVSVIPHANHTDVAFEGSADANALYSITKDGDLVKLLASERRVLVKKRFHAAPWALGTL